jgi:hypothetical protein
MSIEDKHNKVRQICRLFRLKEENSIICYHMDETSGMNKVKASDCGKVKGGVAI